MSTYAVGDLQGCLKPLKKLLKKVRFNDDRDTLWLTGDLVNRGPQSLETLKFVYERRDNIVTVLGNHDLHLLAVNEGIKKASSSDTLDEIITSPDKDQLLYWLRQQPLVHHDKHLNYTLVHAGIPPQWSIKKSLKRAQEVEIILRSDRYHEFLSIMYGNTPSKWKKGLSEHERWRVITNYFTRMRFCTKKGELELTTKAGIHHAPKGYAPWFEHLERKAYYDPIIFGHWAALEGAAYSEHVHALDTGCVWGNVMTMMRLEDHERFSIGCSKI